MPSTNNKSATAALVKLCENEPSEVGLRKGAAVFAVLGLAAAIGLLYVLDDQLDQPRLFGTGMFGFTLTVAGLIVAVVVFFVAGARVITSLSAPRYGEEFHEWNDGFTRGSHWGTRWFGSRVRPFPDDPEAAIGSTVLAAGSVKSFLRGSGTKESTHFDPALKTTTSSIESVEMATGVLDAEIDGKELWFYIEGDDPRFRAKFFRVTSRGPVWIMGELTEDVDGHYCIEIERFGSLGESK